MDLGKSGDRKPMKPCDGYMASSPTTQTFDITDFSTSGNGWLLQGGNPLETFRVTCRDGQASPSPSFCPKLSIFGKAGFDIGGGIGAKFLSKNFESLPFPKFNAYERPIFWGNDSGTDTGSIDLVLFTGRRWILIESNQLGAWHTFSDSTDNDDNNGKIQTSTLLDSISNFFAAGRFHASLLSGDGAISF